MASRLELHEEFCEILESRNVYFQPPESLKMKYPCIRYTRSGVDKQNANDRLYKSINQYEGVVIDSDPDSRIPEILIGHFPMCSIGRGYTADGLNHTPFTMYY